MSAPGLFQDAPPIPLTAQIAEVERELGMRQSVYARRVSEKKMSQTDADKKIDLMRAVLATLQQLLNQGNG